MMKPGCEVCGYKIVKEIVVSKKSITWECTKNGKTYVLKEEVPFGLRVYDGRQNCQDFFLFYESLKKEEKKYFLVPIESFTDKQKSFSVWEHHGRDLFEIIASGDIDTMDRKKLICEILTAVNILHEKKKVHLDLKPENILVNDIGEVKIIDYECFTDDGKTRKDIMGGRTATYMSPESFEGMVDRCADVWSIGLIIFIVYSKCQLVQEPAHAYILQKSFCKSNFYKLDEDIYRVLKMVFIPFSYRATVAQLLSIFSS